MFRISLFQIRLQIKRSVARRNAGQISFKDRDVDDVVDGYVACEPYKDSHVWEHSQVMERAMQVINISLISCIVGVSFIGVPGTMAPPDFGNQLILSQPRQGKLCSPKILASPDFQTFLRPWYG